MPFIQRDIFDEVPLVPAPDGEISNFVDPPSLGPTGIGVSITSMVLVLIFVGIRAVTKICLIKKMHMEDYAMVVAVSLFIVYLGLVIWVGTRDGGRHIWDMPASMAMFQFKAAYIIDITYVLCVCFTKVSLLQQIRRIFSGTKRGWVNIVTVTSIWFNVLYCIAITLAAINICTPVNAYWDLTVEGRCVNWKVAFVSSGVINVVSDVMIFVIPVMCIMQLKLSRRHKLGVAAVFATGGFSCAAAIGRLVDNVQLLQTEDVTYTLMSIGLWSDAEVAAAIISGCMPCVPRFFQSFRSPQRQSTPFTSDCRKLAPLPSDRSYDRPPTAVNWSVLSSNDGTFRGSGRLEKMAELPATPVAAYTRRDDYIECRISIERD